MRFVEAICLLGLLFLFAGCGSTMDDLSPSKTDKRHEAQEGTTGPAVGQKAPGFIIQDSLGNNVTLSSVVETSKGAVLYFTMWCPVCDTHMSHMLNNVVPLYPEVRFFIVDYVSGSVADARNAEISNGYAGTQFTVLADTDHKVLDSYKATMGTTVVIDASGIVRMNEDFKDGSRLTTVLDDLK